MTSSQSPPSIQNAWPKPSPPDAVFEWLEAARSNNPEAITAALPKITAPLQVTTYQDLCVSDLDEIILPVLAQSPLAFSAALRAASSDNAVLAHYFISCCATSAERMAEVAWHFNMDALSRAAQAALGVDLGQPVSLTTPPLNATAMRTLIAVRPDVFAMDPGHGCKISNAASALFDTDAHALVEIVKAAHPRLRQILAKTMVIALENRPSVLCERLAVLAGQCPGFADQVHAALADTPFLESSTVWLLSATDRIYSTRHTFEVRSLTDRLFVGRSVSNILAAMDDPEGMTSVLESIRRPEVLAALLPECIKGAGNPDILRRLIALPQVDPAMVAGSMIGPSLMEVSPVEPHLEAIRVALSALSARPDGADLAQRALAIMKEKPSTTKATPAYWARLQAVVDAGVLAQAAHPRPQGQSPRI